MRILLLSMPDITPASADSMLLPSLGIASLAGNLDTQIHQIKIADLVLRRKDFLKYSAHLLQTEQPELVGLSGLTCSVPTALKMAQQIKTNSPETHIVFGGYMALCHAEELSTPPNAQWIDFLIRGEGEQTFNALVTELAGKKRFESINGLSYKLNGQFIHNPARALADLTQIELPARDRRILPHGFHFWGKPADVVETSRGCTFDCAFCCVAQQYRRTYREFPLDRVLADIEQTYRNGNRFIVLADDNITLDLKRLNQLCDALIHARWRDLRFFAQTAVKPIAEYPEIVSKMRAAGFEIIFLGLENLIQRNLLFLNKTTSNYELARQAVQNLRKNHIISSAGIILGNPDDSAADLWQNFQLIQSLQIDLPNFMTLTPFPKTRIREELIQQKLLTNPDDYARYDLIQANVRTHYLEADELFRLVKRFFRKYYFSWQFIRYNQMIRRYKKFTWHYILKEFLHLIRVKLKI